MPIRKEIYGLRLRNCALRQPSLLADYQRLQGVLQRAGAAHPFALSESEYNLLFTERCFRLGARGSPARGYSSYLYRLCALRKVVKWCGWFLTPKTWNDGQVFGEVEREYRAIEDWIPLQWMATGVLSGERRFSWWTNQLIPPNSALEAALKCGVPSNWVADHSVILRCDTRLLAGVSPLIPSAVDAFDSEVFLTTVESPSREHGDAIDLSRAGSFAPGWPEYVLQDIDVRAIELLPLRITHRNGAVTLDDGVRKSLLTYYDSL